MSSDEELARKLQQEELTSAGLHFPLQDTNATQELDSLTALEIVRILEQEEENVASQNSVQLNEHHESEINSEDSHEKLIIDEHDETNSDSFQLALRLQQEEEEQARQEEIERAARVKNFDYEVAPQEINSFEPHFCTCNDGHNNVITDEEFARAVAATPLVRPQCIPDWQDCRDLNITTDEQVAKLIQEQEQAEEIAHSFKLALQLQEKEEDGAKTGNCNPDRPRIHTHRNAGHELSYQSRELDEATRRVITKIVEEDEAQRSLQLAMRLHQEENVEAGQEEKERLAISVNSDSDDDVLVFKPHRADWRRDPHVNDWTDEDFAGAVAATPFAFAEPRRMSDWSNSRDLCIATDEQVAKLIQEQEQADEMAHSFEMALQLQEKEEDRTNRRNFNPNRPRDQAHRKPTDRRPNPWLRQRALNVNSSGYHHPPRDGGGISNRQFRDGDFYDGVDPFLLQIDERDTDQDAFLLPPGLHNFQVEAGGHNLDVITIPEDSNFEDLLELADAIGDVSCGLSASQIDKLPTRTWTAGGHPSSSDEAKCSICLNDFVPNESVRTLPCKHEFHKHCVDPWLKKKPNCPTCRTDIKV